MRTSASLRAPRARPSSGAPLLTRLPTHPWYDTSRAPTLVLHFPETITDDDLRSLIVTSERWLMHEADGLFAFVVDLRRPFALTAVQREIIAESERVCAPKDRELNAGEAIIVSSPLMRGLVTAVTWASAPVFPYKVVGSLAEALVWTGARLDEAIRDYPDGPSWRARRR